MPWGAVGASFLAHHNWTLLVMVGVPEAFDAMDRNRDGFLDRAEWEAATGQILPEAESSLPAGTAGGFTDPIVRAAVVAKQTAEARMEVSIERKEAAEVARPQPSPTARTMTLIHT